MQRFTPANGGYDSEADILTLIALSSGLHLFGNPGHNAGNSAFHKKMHQAETFLVFRAGSTAAPATIAVAGKQDPLDLVLGRLLDNNDLLTMGFMKLTHVVTRFAVLDLDDLVRGFVPFVQYFNIDIHLAVL